MSDTLAPLAIVTDYLGLVTALRRRIVELGTGMESVDAVAGLPNGYASKLLSRNNKTSLGRVSMGPLLGALGLKLAVLPDDEALAKVIDRLPPRGTKGPKLTTGGRSLPMFTKKKPRTRRG
jgi:hypothetical protein